MKKPKILIVDDQTGFREELVNSPILKSQYIIVGAESSEKAISILEENPHIACIVLDFDFQGSGDEVLMSGLEALDILAEKFPHIPVIMMSGIIEGRGAVAIESIRQNAITFLDKPFTIKSLLGKINSIVQLDKLESDNEAKKAQSLFSELGFYSSGEKMAQFCKENLRAAQTNMNIMITGETGTGKTLLANIIHRLSSRSKSPFIELHCGTISKDANSIRSQIFGHLKGAYTGALQSKQGALEIVEDGTILFDDITDMPPEAQQSLLQAIESKFFYRFGDDKNKISMKARILSSINHNIQDAIQNHLLRIDFKYRLAEEIINMPSLRHHSEDIPFLIENYIANAGHDKCPVKEISGEAMALLKRQPWEGNVRQLIHVVTRCSNRETGFEIKSNTVRKELIKEYNLEESTPERQNISNILESNGDIESTLKKIRKELIAESLKQNKGNKSETARTLGFKNHQSLDYWIKELNLDISDYKY